MMYGQVSLYCHPYIQVWFPQCISCWQPQRVLLGFGFPPGALLFVATAFLYLKCSFTPGGGPLLLSRSPGLCLPSSSFPSPEGAKGCPHLPETLQGAWATPDCCRSGVAQPHTCIFTWVFTVPSVFLLSKRNFIPQWFKVMVPTPAHWFTGC